MSLLPRIKLTDKLWHGKSARFSSHYSKRFYNDGSLTKAHKKNKDLSDYYSKEQFYNEEIEKIQQNKHVLLNINKEKEKFEKIKTRVLVQKRALGKKIKEATVKIQKHIRGYLCRKHHETEMEALKTAKLGISVKAMNRYVGKCCIYLADNIVEASITIQTHIRRHLAQKLLKRLKIEHKAGKKILTFFKVLRNRSRFKKNLENLRVKKKLKEIKHRLRWLRVKEWWALHRICFSVIRRKIKSRRTYNPDFHHKSPARSRVESENSHRSRKSFTVFSESDGAVKVLIEKKTDLPVADDLLQVPGGPVEKIEELVAEESMGLTLNEVNFQRLLNPDVQDDVEELEKGQSFDSQSLEGQSFEDQSLESLESDSIESSKSVLAEKHSEKIEVKVENEEGEEENPPPKDEKQKKPEETPEKPLPSYRKPTAAFNSWKKKPPSPEPTPKEIFPPPKHLLVWTKCRKLYKNQTKKHKSDLSFQIAGKGRKRPRWRPPLTAQEPQKARILPKLVQKIFRIPEFIEPYSYVVPSDTPESPIKINQNEDSDSGEDENSSFEYEAAEFRSIGLSVALPQLHSIVKSYGRNADIKGKRNNVNESDL